MALFLVVFIAHKNMDWMKGVIVTGHGVASGRSGDQRFPEGTLLLQRPFFLEKGMDLSGYFPGTVNVDLAPAIPVPVAPVFDETLAWFPGIRERFLLMKVEVRVGKQNVAGLWYYPHPETKPEHFQPATVVEVLLPWIEGLTGGTEIFLRIIPAQGREFDALRKI